MKKRGVFSAFSIILLLILMPKAYSIYEELIYSGTVKDRDAVNVSNSIFEFRIDYASNKAYVEIDVSAIIIASGECKTKGNFDICISNISFSYRNYTTYTDVYEALVKVYQIKSTIVATNAIGKNDILIDEETTAELSIENTADIVAKDVTATIKLPSSILITNVDGCEKTLNGIVFKADVYPTQIKRCTYNIQGLTGGNFELSPNITYFNGVERIAATSNAINGKVYNHSLKIGSKLNKSDINILEKLELSIDLENTNDQYDLTITALNIKIPKKLLLLKKPKDAVTNNNIISWSGTLAPAEKKSFVAELQGLVTGNYSILTEVSYKISKFSRTAENIADIQVYCDCPYISHDFSQQISVPDQRVGLKAFITNPSSVNYFKNVKISYNTNIPNIQDYSTAYAKISPLETIKIFDSPFITPQLGEIYYFNTTAIYESQNNQFFVVKKNLIIKIPSAEKENMPVEEKSIMEEDEGEVALVGEKPENISAEAEEKEGSKEENPQAKLQDKTEKEEWFKSLFSSKPFDFTFLGEQDAYFSFKRLLMAFYILAIIIVVLVIIARFGKKKVDEIAEEKTGEKGLEKIKKK